MRAEQVIKQLYAALPKKTELFNDVFDVSSLSSVGLTATCVTSQPHNLTVGSFVTVVGALVPNPLVNLEQTDNVASAETQFDHDLTLGYQENVTIQGANESDYNGVRALLSVPNRRNFTYQIENDPSSPATGSPELLESFQLGYNGRQEVTNIIDPNTFEYTLVEALDSPAEGAITVATDPRVSGAASIERAVMAYTRFNTDQLWAFVVLGPELASRDVNTFTDAIADKKQGTSREQNVITELNVYVIAPSTETNSGRVTRDQMVDVRNALFQSLLGIVFEDDYAMASCNMLTFVSHGLYDYINAYYVHRFTFETISRITLDDTIEDPLNVAFRDIELNFEKIDDPDTVIINQEVNLDDDPIVN